MKRTRSPLPVPALPPHARGMRIGLLGGTFNPPHAAHRLISLIAMKRLGLDRIWWLVTPGNPLKDNSSLPNSAERKAQAEAIAAHPRIDVTLIEDAIGTRYTYDTLKWLKTRNPGIHFVWLMGADNLTGFHRWARWRDIASMMPIAVFDRPGSTLAAARSPAALALAAYRVPENRALTLALQRESSWVFFHGRRSHLSSTLLRIGHKPSTGSGLG